MGFKSYFLGKNKAVADLLCRLTAIYLIAVDAAKSSLYRLQLIPARCNARRAHCAG